MSDEPVLLKNRLGPARSRHALFDALRMPTIAAIVWLHTPKAEELKCFTTIAWSALPFLVCGSTFFASRSASKSKTRIVDYCKKRFVALYVPFLAWSLVYFVLHFTKAASIGSETISHVTLSVLWTGTSVHLWFIPFILTTNVAAFVVSTMPLRGWARSGIVGFGALVMGLAVAAAPAPAYLDTLNGAGTFIRGWQALPAALIGMSLAQFEFFGKRRLRTSRALALIGGIAIAAGLLGSVLPHPIDGSLLGCGAFVAAIAFEPSGPAAKTNSLRDMSYGVYLSHILFLKMFRSIGLTGSPISTATSVFVFVATLVLSATLTWVLRRWSYTTWLAP